MSKKTETDWQNLSDRFAREVMDCHEETSYELSVWAWTSNDGKKHWIAQYAWRPDKNLDQAMLVLRTLLMKIGRYAIANLYMCPVLGSHQVTIQNRVATNGVPALYVQSPYADTEMHAVCSAIERYLDEQKEGDVNASS